MVAMRMIRKTGGARATIFGKLISKAAERGPSAIILKLEESRCHTDETCKPLLD
jgi:hypothetical protein